jgi:uncharacterized protein (DUF1697 family)
MNNIIKYCQNIPLVKYSKLVTGGNDPTITTRMKYSKYVNNSRPSRLVSVPINYTNQTNLFIEQYILLHNNININLDNFTKFVQQYQLRKNINVNFSIDDYNALVNTLNLWVQEYKDINGVNININNYNYFIDSLNGILQQFSQENGVDIIIDNLYIENMTTNFINNKLTDEVYYNFLNKIFINFEKNYLSELLTGILPLMPTNKAFYLKRYIQIVDPYGSIWPHYNPDRPIKSNINFLNYY